jgi:hypothetical protein
MRRERFVELAQAYGGDLRHWPEAERTVAAGLMTADASLQAILDEETALDAALGRAIAAAPSGPLRERIIALAPRPARPLWRRGSAWASGAGLAAACVLGLMFGANVSADYLGDPANETVMEATTAFDDAVYFDGLEAG